MTTNPVVWQPSESRARASAMYQLMTARGMRDYASLHAWSITEPAEFWGGLAAERLDFSTAPDCVIEQPGDMTTARWFPGAQLNFAEHLLRREGSAAAIVFRGEDGSRRALTFDDLRAEVARVADGLRESGVMPGDRVAGFLPNCPEAIVAMLATASIGATWSSCSPDFGINGVVDRFGQIEPVVLFSADGYFYNGRRFDSLAAIAGILERIPSIRRTVLVDFAGGASQADLRGAAAWEDFGTRAATLEFVQLPFAHPLYIMYSSGTTGVPKCIVHGAGGTLLKHLTEQLYHCDLTPGDLLFYFTTCGWMMWNWLASGLASGASLLLYDGSPFADDGHILWTIAEEEGVVVFGTSAKYLAAQENAGIRPGRSHDLASVTTILSTGSPLAPASFDYVYRDVADDVLLASISGGTDIIGCFAAGNPMLPVRRGELQSKGLGMDVDVFDDDGRSLVGQSGELVCKRAFPSMPVGFWNDPDGSRYRAAYFERFPGVWAHGDFAELTEAGGMIIHGRSDAVLNPGGVRIGTAEIYRVVDSLDEVAESIAVGQRWDDDVRVVLFVVMNDGFELTDELAKRIRAEIRANTTPRHVPARIVTVPEIPRTISGKIVELAVRAVVHGEPVKNTDALANPGALEYFRDRPELAT